jgi:urea transport system permease protein
VKRALAEAIALMELKSDDEKTQIAAAKALGTLGSIPSQDALKQLESDSADHPEVAKAAADARAQIARHVQVVNTAGTAFRGLSLGSVLLVVAIGLAITFGLMGVINMAHGELIAVGAYTTYIIQNVFGGGLALSPFGYSIVLPGLNAKGAALECYFLVALPLSFLTAALVGILLERSIIRFLYRRPLESLLATWGVSLVLQQLLRLIFGANNVQVYSPSWLSGNWTIFDIILGWNRLFVIGFAVLIIIGTWALLTKTPLGLLIRAVMQNRTMAACMGVRTERVNMLTFGFGSGLAGLAGAFLSQIGNVGPSLGQNYIVDAFMTVVVGGVGSIFGTVISALGIGVADQSLQQWLGNPVLGKILVLVGIILFLQWRPAGLFVTKSRSLES